MPGFKDLKLYPNLPSRWKQNFGQLREMGANLLLSKQLILGLPSYLIPFINKEGKIGFIQSGTCEIIINPQYTDFKGWFDDEKSLVAVKFADNCLWGVINIKNEVIIPCKYISIIPPINSHLFAAQIKDDEDKHKNNIWGVINTSGNKIVEFDKDYASIEGYDGGLCRVHSKTKGWAVLDEMGKDVIPFGKYPNILPIYGSGYTHVKVQDSDNKYHIFEKQNLKKPNNY